MEDLVLEQELIECVYCGKKFKRGTGVPAGKFKEFECCCSEECFIELCS